MLDEIVVAMCRLSFHRRICTLLFAYLVFACASLMSESKDSPPNIVYIVVDDLGVMDVGAYNEHCFYETPSINALADSGMRFDRAYVTSPVCSPSRFSLMTGRYPSRAHATDWFVGTRSGRFLPAVTNDRMPLEEITIAELLKNIGYKTFYAGKWHLGPSEAFYPQNQGFDINQGGYFKGGPYTGNKYFSPFENPELVPDSPPGEHLPDRLAEETARFIEENKDSPFLVCLNFYSVHTPLIGRPDLVAKYEEKSKSVSGEAFGKEEMIPWWNPEKNELITEPFRKVRILQNHAVYAAMVEAMDQAVGKVLQQVEASGLADNTIVIFTSDHGGLSTSAGLPTSNLPYRGGKGWLYEGGIRVPLIIRYPGVTKPGSRYAHSVSTLDIYPTIAAATGATIDHEIDGVSLLPILKGGAVERGPLYWHYPHYANQGGFPGGVVMMGDNKLLLRYEDGKVQLYDVSNDPGEEEDLASSNPELVAAMKTKLYAWLESQDAHFLRPRPEQGSPVPWYPSQE